MSDANPCFELSSTNLDSLIGTTSNESRSRNIKGGTKDAGFRLKGAGLRYIIKILKWSPRVIIPECERAIIA
jgi:hypothetical protein